MVKVLYDHQIFTEQTYGGISRYFKYLMNGIKKTEQVEYKLGLLRSNNYYIRDEQQPLSSPLFNPLFKTQEKLLKRNNSYSKYLLKKNDFSVFHPTYFNPYFLKYLKKPLVITVHDMTYEALPQFFPSSDPLPFYKRILMEKADKIIAISEITKTDILKYSNVNVDKIEVVHHGIDLAEPVYAPVEGLPEQYILFVGARWSYKNFHLTVEAFKKLTQKYPGLRLVFAGGGALSYGDSEFLIRNNILDKTIQLSVSDDQLNTLYKNALCFVYPSLYEGFGLPILEAFKNNCPVLLSNCSCFEEIAGNAAQYFDGQSLQSLTEKLEIIISSSPLRREMGNAGKKKSLEYPIDKCISKTIELYKKII
ncbi:glycosyltransferase family 4 protein [Pedobacter sp. GR22-10]|uniref:glycosyltransferase family 4 protein n=1 Tax=Pedobacter sp. GR22-10 TaxID=2994472 RepID=UPI002245D3A3|nr:glycosyltransferase family 1 protein [Pedobacter sp. GR22-10]MCX2433140.1 glycosyltransferase family 1 protein [Pedobacter sp. GR22-10]